MPSDLNQRYNGASDTSTSTAIPFDVDDAAKLVGVSKIVFGEDGAAVTRVTASVGLPVTLLSGSAAFGKLAANSGVDIGDVDVTSIIPGTGATNLGKAIDTATGATDTGVLSLATRDDALSALTPVEGDNVQLRVDANGALWTIISGTVTVGSHAVTNAGTFAVQVDGAALTSLQLIDDAVYAEDAASAGGDKGLMILAKRLDTPANSSGTDGDYEPIQMSGGRVWVDASGKTLTVANAGTFAVQVDGSALTALQLIDDAVYAEDVAAQAADKGIAILAVRRDADTSLVGTDNDYANLQVDANGYLKVEIFDGGGSHTVDNNGTFVVQVDGTALTRLTDIETNTDSLAVVGNGAAATALRVSVANDSTGILAGVTTVTTVTTCSTVTTLTGSGIAHDSADSGNPHKIGAKATTSLSGITLVADADRTNLFAGVDGVLITRPHANLEDVVQERTTNTDGASTAFASGMGAPGANVRLWVTNITIANSSASFCTVDIRDGAAGSVLWTIPVPATGGAICRFDPPLKLTANTALAFDASAATSTLSISANGFKSKV